MLGNLNRKFGDILTERLRDDLKSRNQYLMAQDLQSSHRNSVFELLLNSNPTTITAVNSHHHRPGSPDYNVVTIFGVNNGSIALCNSDFIQVSGDIDVDLRDTGENREVLSITATASPTTKDQNRKTVRLRKPLRLKELYISSCEGSQISLENSATFCVDAKCTLFAQRSKISFNCCFFDKLLLCCTGRVLTTAVNTIVNELSWETTGEDNDFGSPTILSRLKYQCTDFSNSISAYLDDGAVITTNPLSMKCCKSYFVRVKSPGRKRSSFGSEEKNGMKCRLDSLSEFTTIQVPEKWNGPTCMICRSNYPNTKTLPCGHNTHCYSCAQLCLANGSLLGKPCLYCCSVIVSDIQVIDPNTYITLITKTT